jgi:hypothetical protein
MRYSILALAVVPLLVSSVRPQRVDSRGTVLVSADSCAAVVEDALREARDRTTGATQPSRQFFFEFEATVPAAIVGKTSAPSIAPDSGALVQFIVDSAGRVDTSTVRLLAARGSRMGRTELATLIGGWPFTPGQVKGCPVTQLVQMSVR